MASNEPLTLENSLSTVEFAAAVEKTSARVIQLIGENKIKAQKIGRDWRIHKRYVAIVKALPETRGRKKIVR